MRYIVIDERRDGTGDMFSTEFDSLLDAMWYADGEWDHLTDGEKEQRTVRVLDSANPDEEAENHFDGDYEWIDGLYIHGVWKVSSGISNDALDELGSEVNAETIWTYKTVCEDAENFGMTPFEFVSRYLREVRYEAV